MQQKLEESINLGESFDQPQIRVSRRDRRMKEQAKKRSAKKAAREMRKQQSRRGRVYIEDTHGY